jgi:hypothetical protein
MRTSPEGRSPESDGKRSPRDYRLGLIPLNPLRPGGVNRSPIRPLFAHVAALRWTGVAHPFDQGKSMNKLLSTLILAAFAAFAVTAQAAAPAADTAASAPAKKSHDKKDKKDKKHKEDKAKKADKSASAPK